MRATPRLGRRSNLPIPLTPLIGRQRDFALAQTLLGREDVRLLTIIGPGGICKTRLAIEIGHAEIGPFPDGVVFVPLAAIDRSDQIEVLIAQALGIPRSAGVNVRTSAMIALQDATTLLILDNFEHVLDGATFLTELLVRCPDLKMLVTSRALLRVEGEYALPVPPLVIPEIDGVTSPLAVADAPAVQLFVHRAQAVDPEFALTGETAPVVAGICRHLDGLPLAIELAAAQCAVLPPEDIRTRIEARLGLPVAGPRDAPVRLRNLRDTVAWSYDLLTPDEQSLFRRLGIFAGGFTLDAAEHVGGQGDRGTGGQTDSVLSPQSSVLSLSPCPPVPPPSVFDGIAALIDKSLIQQEEWQGSPRYVMLETIRGFAWDQLHATGEFEAVGDAHAGWCLELAECNPLASFVEPQLRRLEVDQANLRIALAWLDRRKDGERLLRLAAGLARYWYARCLYREGREWLERALASDPGSSPHDRARALDGLGRLLAVQSEATAAEPLLDEAIGLLRARPDDDLLARALGTRGVVANQLGDYDRAEHFLSEGLELVSARHDLTDVASLRAAALANLGVAAHGRGDFVLAAARHEQALAISRAHGYAVGATRSLRDLAEVARDQGDFARALSYYRECLVPFDAQGDLLIVVDVLEGSALAAAVWQQPVRAARLLGAAEALREQFGSNFIVPADIASHARAVTIVRAAIGESALQDAWASGRTLTLTAAFAEIDAIAPPEPAAGRPLDPATVKLSAREAEVLRFLVAGQSDRAIAETLTVSVRTVEVHVSRILAKLGVRTRSAAAASALAAGLVEG